MRRKSKNVFNEGMSLDAHASAQSPAMSRNTKNFRIFTRDNNSYILTNVKGNELWTQLSDGFVPLVMKEFNGIAYILSAEVVDGEATGRGEIGSFPSPSYTGPTGYMDYVYRPLMNYGGDDGSYDELDGPFVSDAFNFDLVNLVSMELQMDYDGTINIIFTDGKNPMRIINSGFVDQGGMEYEIIDRSGSKDSNRYTFANWENTLQLISRSGKILEVEFAGNSSGGQVPCGTLQYMFAYATADGNETEIIGSSFSVPTYLGDKIININGGRNSGDKSDKINILNLHNVDDSYAFVVVYYIIAYGMSTENRETIRISTPYPITSTEMTISHTGYEQTEVVSLGTILANTVSIGTVDRIAQSDGHLIAGGITEKTRDYDTIREFSKKIRLNHKELTLDVMGSENNFGRAVAEPFNFNGHAGTDGFNGGYANPKNVHDRLGYWGGEAYPFAFRLIFPDGVKSPAFPCIGIDNVDNTNGAYIDGVSQGTIDGLPESGYSADNKMLNNLGIYRFPNRGAINTNQLFSVDESTGEGRLKIFGITFKIPDLGETLSTGKKITDIAIGIQFLRGERRPDVVVQGTAIDTIMVPAIDFDHAGTSEKLWNYNEPGGYNESNSKLVPAWGHILESADVWASVREQQELVRSRVDNGEPGEDGNMGIEPFLLNVMRRDPHEKLTGAYKSPFALYSTDTFVRPDEMATINNLKSSVRIISEITHQATVKTNAARQTAETANHFSVLVPTKYDPKSGTKLYNGQSAFANDGSDYINTARFSTVARFQGRDNGGEHYRLFRNRYNSYIGLRLDGTPFRMSTPAADGEIGTAKYGMLGQKFKYSFLANIYRGPAQRTYSQVAQVYSSIDNISYFPITQPMYFNESVGGVDAIPLEDRLDGEGKLLAYNGDNFVTLNYRKIWQNAEFKDPEFVNKSTVVRTGYTIGVVNEGNFNGSIRSSEVKDITEGERRQPWDYSQGQISPPGDVRGAGAPWREYTLYETSGYNRGYDMTDGNATSLAIPANTPYVRSYWRTRLWASAKHIPNSFINGYRDFSQRTFRDYPTKYGNITQIISNNNNLFLIQQRAIGSIVVNEKVQVANASGGAVYVSTGDILSKLQVITEEVGSKHMHSIVSSDNGLYGVSTDLGLIWAFSRGEMNRISDGKIKSLLNEQYVKKQLPKIKMLHHDIVSAWNKEFDEIVFTFYAEGEGPNDPTRSFTVSFSEITGKIHSFLGFVPFNYGNVGNKLVSFNYTNGRRMWMHDSDNVPYANFYGVQDSSLVSVVPNQGDEEKTFTNIVIEGNNCLPSGIEFKVQGAKVGMEPDRGQGNVINRNIEYENGEVRITIPKLGEDIHHQDVEQKIPQEKAGARTNLRPGSRVKGKYMIAEFTYSGETAVEIKSIATVYKSLQ